MRNHGDNSFPAADMFSPSRHWNVGPPAREIAFRTTLEGRKAERHRQLSRQRRVGATIIDDIDRILRPLWVGEKESQIYRVLMCKYT